MAKSRSPSAPIASAARRLGVGVALALLASCVHVPPAGIGAPIAWDALPGWSEERHAQAWPALAENCKALGARDVRWGEICAAAAALGEPDDNAAREFFQTHFTPYLTHTGEEEKPDGLVTGYYEPLLNGSRTRSERFRYPIHARPDDLLIVDLGDVYPELKGKRLRARVDGRRVVPYHSRAQIEKNGHGGRNGSPPIVWVDDPVALFFLHVQGSGRVQLPDGQTLFLGYADQNGHPYRSLGRRLVDAGVLKLEDVSMQSIRAWLAANPDQLQAMLHSNPSYIFFEERANDLPGPIGAMRAPLLPERAIAVDPAFVPLGSPVWLDTTLPTEPSAASAEPYRRLVFAQDTGGAIKGPVRADVFFGFGPRAEELAGKMKQPGKLYVLLPAVRISAK